MIEGGDLQPEGHVPAQADGERGGLDIPVSGVGHDDRVGGKLVAVLFEEVGERQAAAFLFTLDEDGKAEVEVRAEGVDKCADRRDVRHHARLVVGRATPVQAVAEHRRLVRRRVPVGVIPWRLHVVVGVEQDGWLAAARGARREHRRLAQHVSGFERCARDLHGIEDAEILQQRLRSPRRSPARGCGRSRPTRRTGCAPGRTGRRWQRGGHAAPPRAMPSSTAADGDEGSGGRLSVMQVILSDPKPKDLSWLRHLTTLPTPPSGLDVRRPRRQGAAHPQPQAARSGPQAAAGTG